jgi:hypothetical protein
VIYATTRVNSFTIFLLSLFYCRQNLSSNIYLESRRCRYFYFCLFFVYFFIFFYYFLIIFVCFYLYGTVVNFMWLVPEADRTFSTGALWRQWLMCKLICLPLVICIYYTLHYILHIK